MLSREDIFEALLQDGDISDAMLELSGSYRAEKDLRHAFSPYYRLCAAISELVEKLDLVDKHAPPEAEGLGKLVPFVAMALPGFSKGFVEHWADEYLLSQATDPLFFNEAAQEAYEEGEAGKANYLHGLLVCAAVSDAMMQMMGAQLLVGAALNLDQGLENSGSAGEH